MMNNNTKYRIVSLFSGCGGLDIPFSEDKYEFAGAYDNDPAAIKCLNHNLRCNAKVLDVLSEDFTPEMKAVGSADIVLGGFPCQGFSKSGPKKENDPRNKLYKSMLNAVDILQPKIFIAENVDGLVQNFKGSFVEQIITDFNEIGYDVEHRILNAVNYGVSQYRRRIFFVGKKKESNSKFDWPEPKHEGKSRNGEFKTKWDVFDRDSLFFQHEILPSKTIKDSIEDLLDIKSNIPDHIHLPISEKDVEIMKNIGEGKKLCNVRFSNTSVYTWNIPKVFGEISEKEKAILEIIGKNRRKKIYGNIPNGNPLSIEVIKELSGFDILPNELNSLIDKGYLKLKNNKYDLKGAMFASGIYKRPNWNEPSPTVLTVFDNPRFFFHPLKNRPFTIREAARLQSFPDSFEFINSGISIKDAYRLIGNAVPPLLASHLEKAIFNYLNKEGFNETRTENININRKAQ